MLISSECDVCSDDVIDDQFSKLIRHWRAFHNHERTLYLIVKNSRILCPISI